jgi:hypothetical protein
MIDMDQLVLLSSRMQFACMPDLVLAFGVNSLDGNQVTRARKACVRIGSAGKLVST